MLPLDRLVRAGATEDEIAALEALTVEEQLSIELELQPVAESGVREFLERFRSRLQSEAEAAEPVEIEAEPEPKPETTQRPVSAARAASGGVRDGS